MLRLNKLDSAKVEVMSAKLKTNTWIRGAYNKLARKWYSCLQKDWPTRTRDYVR